MKGMDWQPDMLKCTQTHIHYTGTRIEEQSKNMKLYSALRHTPEIFMILHVLSSSTTGHNTP